MNHLGSGPNAGCMRAAAIQNADSVRRHARVAVVSFLALPVVLTLAWASPPQPPEGFSLGGDPARGKAIYETFCQSCHGPKGDGRGPIAATRNPRPRDFTDAERMSKISHWEIYLANRDGGQAVGLSQTMVAWKEMLTDQQIRDLGA